MCITNDGFRISEEDLKLRGPGDFFGSRQHGLPVFRIGNLAQDLSVLKQAQEAATAVICGADPIPEGLAEELEDIWNGGELVLN